eukprot:3937221-Rhodomonas_salina.1
MTTKPCSRYKVCCTLWFLILDSTIYTQKQTVYTQRATCKDRASTSKSRHAKADGRHQSLEFGGGLHAKERAACVQDPVQTPLA